MGLGGLLSLGAGGLGAIGALSEGQAARSQARFQAAVNEQQAARERQIAAEEERDFRRRQSHVFAERRAAMGASGVEGGTGTPLMTASDFASEAELQAQRIREGGAIRSTRLEQEAQLVRSAGRAAERRGRFRAGASLLSGAAGAFSHIGFPSVE